MEQRKVEDEDARDPEADCYQVKVITSGYLSRGDFSGRTATIRLFVGCDQPSGLFEGFVLQPGKFVIN